MLITVYRRELGILLVHLAVATGLLKLIAYMVCGRCLGFLRFHWPTSPTLYRCLYCARFKRLKEKSPKGDVAD